MRVYAVGIYHGLSILAVLADACRATQRHVRSYDDLALAVHLVVQGANIVVCAGDQLS